MTDSTCSKHEASSRTTGTSRCCASTDFHVEPGKVTALIGDNGAGKSTLVKILSGVMPPQGGKIRMHGEPVSFDSPTHARDCGIETVYQDLALAPDLGPAENAYIGRELLKPGLLGQARGPRQEADAAQRRSRRSPRSAPTSRTWTPRWRRCPAASARAWPSAGR